MDIVCSECSISIWAYCSILQGHIQYSIHYSTYYMHYSHIPIYTQVVVYTVYGLPLCPHTPEYTFHRVLMVKAQSEPEQGWIWGVFKFTNIQYCWWAFANVFSKHFFFYFSQILQTLAINLRKLFSTDIQGDDWRVAIVMECTKLFSSVKKKCSEISVQMGT